MSVFAKKLFALICKNVFFHTKYYQMVKRMKFNVEFISPNELTQRIKQISQIYQSEFNLIEY